MKLPTAGTAAALLLLSACGGNDEAANSGVTVEEAATLNDTENMLDVSPDSLAATENAPLGNGEEPAEESQSGELPVADQANQE